ncbi:DUF881 domain-containing protein [Pilimelia columellifera]|uniref:DUF881 domain-containing protein n=1 Tax=Pilimelia columellifera subsp. columellifera TaxID=706583 RepID=A0ABN3NPV6_9ACTN
MSTDDGEASRRSGRQPTGVGWPGGVTPDPAPSPPDAAEPSTISEPGPGRRSNSASAMIAVLLALLGFAMVVQLRHVAADSQLSSAREDDLVSILSDLEARETRLNVDIRRLEDSQRQLNSGAQRREAALADAARRADELGLLAGALPAEGRGMRLRLEGDSEALSAGTVLDAVQSLRNAAAEAMQIRGAHEEPVRIVASSYFVDQNGQLKVDGRLLSRPYTIEVIGDPSNLRSSLTIPGGVVPKVRERGGNVTMDDLSIVEVTARYSPTTLKFARPAS